MKKSMIICVLVFVFLLSGCDDKTSDSASATASPVTQAQKTPAKTPEPAASPTAAQTSPVEVTDDGTAPAYEMTLFEDKKQGIEMKMPVGWTSEKTGDELVRFTGPIKGGGSGLVIVSKIDEAFVDLAAYDDYTETLVMQKSKGSTLQELKGFLFSNESGDQGRFITLNYKTGIDVTCELYYFLPDGDSSYMIVCSCTGKDFNSVFKTYMGMMLSFKP